MEVKILGTGCPKCQKLYDVVERAVAASGVQANLIKVEKINEIITYGVAVTPSLVIADEVKSAGKIPDVKQIAGWLTDSAAKG